MVSFLSRFQCVLPEFYKKSIVSVIKRSVGSEMSNKNWVDEKAKYLDMSPSSKRKSYACGDNYITVGKILNWYDYFLKHKVSKTKLQELQINKSLNNTLSRKISVWSGDITHLEVDAIVNAANNSLLGGGGVDGAIHRAASGLLKAECATLNGCDTGDAKITGGYRLPARYVIHTVGPVGEKPGDLKNCYNNCLDVAIQNNLKTVAFPCISTGIYGYPNEKAAHVALSTVRSKFEKHPDKFERIIFVVFLPQDKKIYEDHLQTYFPVE